MSTWNALLGHCNTLIPCHTVSGFLIVIKPLPLCLSTRNCSSTTSPVSGSLYFEPGPMWPSSGSARFPAGSEQGEGGRINHFLVTCPTVRLASKSFSSRQHRLARVSCRCLCIQACPPVTSDARLHSDTGIMLSHQVCWSQTSPPVPGHC